MLQPQSLIAGYSAEEQPFAGYAALMALFGGSLTAALVAAHRKNRLPQAVSAVDVLTVGVATHKIARLITKDSVTSLFRAPFVHLDEKSGTNSLEESARGSGLQRSIGELLSCPECTGQWVAAALTTGMLHAPRPTRAITMLYSSVALADLLQFAYSGLKSRA